MNNILSESSKVWFRNQRISFVKNMFDKHNKSLILKNYFNKRKNKNDQLK
jgi:hypothetical protein